MVVILVAITFLTAILGGVILRRLTRKGEVISAQLGRAQMALSPVTVAPDRARALQFPQNVYYHNGHSWVKLEDNHGVRIGCDDFTQQVMGDIEAIEVPPVGSHLKQGKAAWKLRSGNRKLNQLAPLGGKVVEVNEKLMKNPSLVNLSPYEKGWIMKIRPEAFGEEMPQLMDSFQFQIHFDRLKSKLRSFSHPQSLGMIYSDGGEVIQGVGRILDERLWRVLVTELFHTTPE